VGRVKRNILASIVGQAAVPLAMLASMPFYIRLMGMESVGLIGLFVAIQALARLVDAGLSMTLARELARLSVDRDNAGQMRTLLRTLAVVYWGIGACVGLALIAAASVIAHRWVQPEQLSVETVTRTVALMGLTVALQWPSILYQAGLIGLQRHVSLAAIDVATAALRFLGVIPVLWLLSPTIQCFFIYQAAILAVRTALVGGWLWRKMPRSDQPPAFQWRALKSVWRFAAGVGGAGFARILLTHGDKVILSKMLSLEMFGYYSVAAMLAMGLQVIWYPVFMAVQPRLTELIARDQIDRLVQLYHRASQLISALLMPVAVVLVLFSREILLLWTADASLATNGKMVLSFLAAGACAYGLFAGPFALQMADGRTRLVLAAHAVAAALLIPLMIAMTSHLGPPGAAAAWLIANVCVFLIGGALMHRRVLRAETWRWVAKDIALPLVAVGIAVGLGRWVAPADASRLVLAAWLAGVAVIAFAAAFLAAPDLRKSVWAFLRRARPQSPQPL